MFGALCYFQFHHFSVLYNFQYLMKNLWIHTENNQRPFIDKLFFTFSFIKLSIHLQQYTTFLIKMRKNPQKRRNHFKIIDKAPCYSAWERSSHSTWYKIEFYIKKSVYIENNLNAFCLKFRSEMVKDHHCIFSNPFLIAT